MEPLEPAASPRTPPAHPGLFAAGLFYALLIAALIGRLAVPLPSIGLWAVAGLLSVWRLACALAPDRYSRPPFFQTRWNDAPVWVIFAVLVIIKLIGETYYSSLLSPTAPDVLKAGVKIYTVHSRYSVLLWAFPALLAIGGLGASPKPKTGQTAQFRPASIKIIILFFSLAWLTLYLMFPDMTTLARSAGIYLSDAWLVPALFIPGLFLIYLIAVHSYAGLTLWRGRLALGLRWLLFAALCAAVAGPYHRDVKNETSVVYLLDVSRSIPADVQSRALAFIADTATCRAPEDAAALLVFGGDVQTEQSLDVGFVQGSRLMTDITRCAPQATRIDVALDAARALFPEGGRKRIVLLTDGNQTTGDDPVERASRLNAASIALDIVPLEASIVREVIVDKMVLSADVLHAGEAFDVDVLVESFSACVIDVNLFNNGELIRREENIVFDAPPADSVAVRRVTFRNIRAPENESLMNFEATIDLRDSASDAIPDNNGAFAAALIGRNLDTLIMTSDKDAVRPLVAALVDEGNMKVDVRTTDSLPPAVDLLHNYDCIILANIDRYDLGAERDAALEVAVRDYGVGLAMIGGISSFGAGGYIGSAVERALPVTCDVKDNEVLSNGALVVILHTCEFMDGNVWAKKIAQVALEQLTAGDFYGVCYFGWNGGDSWLFKPLRCTDDNRTTMMAQIRNVTPGDMPAYEPTMRMAADELEALGTSASVRHIIIITDGDASPPSGATIQRLRDLNCTVTSIAINPHGGAEIATMKRVAEQTGGKYMLVNDPAKLPRIFAREARVVRRSLLYENPNGIPILLNKSRDNGMLAGIDQLPPVNGLVITSERELPSVRTMATIALEGNRVPLLAWRQYGLGQTVAFTSDASDRWASRWVSQWEGYSAFWAQIVRKLKRKTTRRNFSVELNPLPDSDDVNIVVSIRGDDASPDSKTAVNAHLRLPSGESMKLDFEQDGGRFVRKIKKDELGSYILGVQLVDSATQEMTQPTFRAFSHNASIEFKKLRANRPVLSAMAQRSAGQRKTPVELDTPPAEAGFFARDTEAFAAAKPLFWYCILVALILAPIDIFVRRVFLDVDRFVRKVSLAFWKRVPGQAERCAKIREELDTETQALDAARRSIGSVEGTNASAQRDALLEALEAVDPAAFEFDSASDAPSTAAPQPSSVNRQALQDAPTETHQRPDDDSFGRLLRAKRRTKK
ncbi:MAG: glutamine amidotransferase [Planctomycetota bacterium]